MHDPFIPLTNRIHCHYGLPSIESASSIRQQNDFVISRQTLNLNIDLLFEKQSTTKDNDLNSLIDDAKERYLKPNDQSVALEKLWDAFERMKTYYDNNKRKSAEILVNRMATDLEATCINQEFEELTKIGNSYRIRHHETDKRSLTDPNQIKYLFFRMLSLIDLAVVTIQKSDDII